MINFSNIKEHSITRPDDWTCFGSPKEFDLFPQEHKDQIFFLNKDASTFLTEYLQSTKIISDGIGYDGENWLPFTKNIFKLVEQFQDNIEHKILKKWLYNLGIPFRNEVYIISYFSEIAILTTWKMVVKYELFFPDDLIIFDKTQNWCLYFFHEGRLIFGKENIYDPEIGYNKMKELNEIKEKYPNIKFPF